METVLAFTPQKEGAFIDFGGACLRLGMIENAIQWLDRAVAVNPSRRGTHKDIALVIAENVRKSDIPALRARMVSEAEWGFAGTRKNEETLAERAKLHLMAGERPQAEVLFRQILHAKEVYADTLRLIGQAWLQAGFTTEALQTYHAISAGRGGGGTSAFGLWAIGPDQPLAVGQDYGFTITLSEKSRKRALANAAMDLVKANLLDEALPLMEDAWLTDAEDTNNLLQFGQVCLEAEEQDKAAAFFFKAVKADPKDREIWYTLANIYANQAWKQRPKAAPSPQTPPASDAAKLG
jgi:tetratricopeptide (TPR) repeat protein